MTRVRTSLKNSPTSRRSARSRIISKDPDALEKGVVHWRSICFVSGWPMRARSIRRGPRPISISWFRWIRTARWKRSCAILPPTMSAGPAGGEEGPGDRMPRGIQAERFGRGGRVKRHQPGHWQDQGAIMMAGFGGALAGVLAGAVRVALAQACWPMSSTSAVVEAEARRRSRRSP